MSLEVCARSDRVAMVRSGGKHSRQKKAKTKA